MVRTLYKLTRNTETHLPELVGSITRPDCYIKFGDSTDEEKVDSLAIWMSVFIHKE